MQAETITVVIADDHEMSIEGFSTMLSKIKEVKLLGIAMNGKELVDLVLEKQPQIVITDVRMPVLDGVAATIVIKEKLPETKVLGLSAYDEIPLVNDMMDAGANGFLLKNLSIEELRRAFEAVLLDEDFFSAEIAHIMYNSKIPFFTKKEVEVMILIAKDKSSKEIADELCMSMRTLEKHRQSLERKIGTRSVVGVALFAMKNGYLRG
jgi:two-component system nitrate/nitrite response regulator NarL